MHIIRKLKEKWTQRKDCPAKGAGPFWENNAFQIVDEWWEKDDNTHLICRQKIKIVT